MTAQDIRKKLDEHYEAIAEAGRLNRDPELENTVFASWAPTAIENLLTMLTESQAALTRANDPTNSGPDGPTLY